MRRKSEASLRSSPPRRPRCFRPDLLTLEDRLPLARIAHRRS
jgi:hypothetical protein